MPKTKCYFLLGLVLLVRMSDYIFDCSLSLNVLLTRFGDACGLASLLIPSTLVVFDGIMCVLDLMRSILYACK